MAICVPELRKSSRIQVSTDVQTAKRQTARRLHAWCQEQRDTFFVKVLDFFGCRHSGDGTFWKIMNMLENAGKLWTKRVNMMNTCGKWWKRWNDIIMMNICGILPNLVIFWFGPFCHPQLDCCEEPARHPTVASRDWSSSRLKVWVSLRMGYPPKNGGFSSFSLKEKVDLIMRTGVDIGLWLVCCHFPI